MFKRITRKMAKEMYDTGCVYYDCKPYALQPAGKKGMYEHKYVGESWPKPMAWESWTCPEYIYYLYLEE